MSNVRLSDGPLSPRKRRVSHGADHLPIGIDDDPEREPFQRVADNPDEPHGVLEDPLLDAGCVSLSLPRTRTFFPTATLRIKSASPSRIRSPASDATDEDDPYADGIALRSPTR